MIRACCLLNMAVGLPSFPSVVLGIAKSAYKHRQDIMDGFDKGFNGGG